MASSIFETDNNLNNYMFYQYFDKICEAYKWFRDGYQNIVGIQIQNSIAENLYKSTLPTPYMGLEYSIHSDIKFIKNNEIEIFNIELRLNYLLKLTADQKALVQLVCL
jgi:hypothetical protein